jgi:hypothetical protein
MRSTRIALHYARRGGISLVLHRTHALPGQVVHEECRYTPLPTFSGLGSLLSHFSYRYLQAYHEGFSLQVEKWPVNPLECVPLGHFFPLVPLCIIK